MNYYFDRRYIIDNALYRKNVFKTLSIAPAKLGLRQILRKSPRVSIVHASIGMATESMELLGGLGPYLLGSSQLTDKMKINAFEECGDFSYYLFVLCKFLKYKLPSSSKKVKLKDQTRSAALIEIVYLSGEILNLSKKYFYGPTMVEGVRQKQIKTLDSEGKATGTSHVVEEKVPVINVEATDAMIAGREDQIRKFLDRLIPLFWAFVYETFEVPPSHVFVGNIAKLEKRYGKGFFDLSEAEARDTEVEIDAMSEAAQSIATVS